MKYLVFIIVILFCSFNDLNSQNIKYSISILIEGDSEFTYNESTIDNYMVQTFILKSQLCSNHKTFRIDENGKLNSSIKIKSSNQKNNLVLIYKNIYGNEPLIKDKKEAFNILKYPNDFQNVSLDSIYDLLSNAENIYLIETDEILGYYLLKKVELK